MAKANKQQLLAENLYEIPSCTICLQELAEDICCLDCGHVFHMLCIEQHFEYKSTCPNCQKRTHRNQIRPLIFQLVLNSQANEHLHTILAALDGSERKQVEHLLREIKVATESVQRMKVALASNEKDLAAEKKAVEGLKEDLTKKRAELDLLRKENVILEKNGRGLSDELNQRNKRECYLQMEVNRLRKQEEDYDKYKKYKKLANERSPELMKYKEDLEQAKTPQDEMARQFFQMALMKNLLVLKEREEKETVRVKIEEQKLEMERLKGTIESLKKEITEGTQKRAAERKKYEGLKAKYRVLSEKAKQNGGLRENDIPEIEDSQQGFISFPKSILPLEEQLGQQTIRKPIFNSTSTIGGLNPRKRDDKLKFTA